MGWDVCRWTSPCQVEEFLRHHGGEEASTHKSDMIQLTGGNIGVMEDKGHETMGQQPETSTNVETLKLAHISCRTWRKRPKRHHGKKQSPNGLWCKNIRSRSSWALTTKVALAPKRRGWHAPWRCVPSSPFRGQQPETSTNVETLKLAHISCRTWRKRPKRHHGKKQSPNGLWCKNIRSRSSWALTTKVALAPKRRGGHAPWPRPWRIAPSSSVSMPSGS